MHIGIIGGGFTGCLLAAQVLRSARPGDAITLIERAETLGRGAAYGTDNPDHLLNVRAGNMGAFPDAPQHFHAWLTERFGADAPPASAFVSRMRYGEYVAGVFQKAVAARAGEVTVSIVCADATELHPGPQPAVKLADGRRFAFDRLALCIGNLPSGLPPITEEARASGRYIHDPWRSQEYTHIPAGEPIFIIGSGLTMIDVALTLAPSRRGTKMIVASRHGLLPHRHEAAKPYKMDKPIGTLLEMFRTVRKHAKAAPSVGHDWRDVIDALRPWTTELWRAFTGAERAQFLRHIRPYWEVHRHRLAPALSDAVDDLKARGDLFVGASRIEAIRWNAAHKRLEVDAKPRGQSKPMPLHVGWVINCTGPQSDYARTANPLVKHAVETGAIRPDPLRLSLDVNEEGAVIDARGHVSANIFAVGPPTRGAFWEITAVPDIRRDCARMAGVLLR